MVSTIRPTKSEVNRVRVTVGGNRLNFPGATTTHCSSLTTTKFLLNSTISTPGARFITLDIKYFYYCTDMARYDYMKLALACIPDKIVDQYNLRALSSDGWVYFEIQKVMPGLKQSGCIANNQLKARLAHFGFALVPRTTALWKHTNKPITFSLVVDDFGVNYIGKENANHLISIAVKPTMLASLSSISAQQEKCTEQIYADTRWLLNYASTHPDATIGYTTSDMVLHINSNTSYLSEP